MTDLELLELAAKAAGFKRWSFESWPDYLNVYYGNDDIDEEWNPLYEDADAIRLAIQLRMDIRTGTQNNCVTVGWGSGIRYVEEVFEKDPMSAVRRAIVRAAAEIGKAMP